MSLKLTNEQIELQDSIRSFFREQLTSEYLRKRIAAKTSHDEVLWGKILELGLVSFFASDDKESRGGFRDLGIIAFESGYALLPENLSESVLGGVFLLYCAADGEEKKTLAGFLGDKLLSELGKGSAKVSIAPQSGTAVTLKKGAEASGELIYAASADASALIGLFSRGRFYLAKTPGAAAPLASLDETRKHFSLSLKSTACLELSEKLSSKIQSMVRTMKAMEIAGAAQRVVEMTVDYVKTRKQYGVPVGGFQAVQHKIADMHLEAESMRALSHFAAWAADESPDQLEVASYAAIANACEMGPKCVEAAIQMHGGIGFTWEFDLHLFLRRVRSLEALYSPTHEDYDSLLELAMNQ